jgi:hypothetical protein
MASFSASTQTSAYPLLVDTLNCAGARASAEHRGRSFPGPKDARSNAWRSRPHPAILAWRSFTCSSSIPRVLRGPAVEHAGCAAGAADHPALVLQGLQSDLRLEPGARDACVATYPISVGSKIGSLKIAAHVSARISKIDQGERFRGVKWRRRRPPKCCCKSYWTAAIKLTYHNIINALGDFRLASTCIDMQTVGESLMVRMMVI